MCRPDDFPPYDTIQGADERAARIKRSLNARPGEHIWTSVPRNGPAVHSDECWCSAPTDERAALAARHKPYLDPVGVPVMRCEGECGDWPCDTARALALLDDAVAEALLDAASRVTTLCLDHGIRPTEFVAAVKGPSDD